MLDVGCEEQEANEKMLVFRECARMMRQTRRAWEIRPVEGVDRVQQDGCTRQSCENRSYV
jgi:hypothetical protein